MNTQKNLLLEVNSLRKQMNLKPLTEAEFQLNEAENLMNEIDLFLKEEIINEGWLENAKYYLSKLGTYKEGGKIWGKPQARARAAAQISAILDKVANAALKKLDTSIKQTNVEFPNNRSQEDFLKTILEIAAVYDSIVASTKLQPDQKGYLPIDAANEVIEDLRTYVQKYLDYDLTAAFTIFNEEEENEENVLFNEADEDLAASKQQVKDKFADTKSKVKSGELQGYETERMKTLNSKKLPAILAGIGGALGAIGWIAQTDWFKDLVMTTIQNPAKLSEKYVTEIINKNVVVDPNGWSYTLQNNGFMDATGKSLNFDQPVDNLKKAFQFYGGGDMDDGIESMSKFLGDNNRSASVDELARQLSDPSNKTVGDVFNKLEGTWGDKFFMSQTGGAKAAIAKFAFTTIKRELVKGTTSVVAKSAIGAKLIAAAPALSVIGIALVAGAATVALARYKGKKSSRAQILNDLVQYIRPIEGTKQNPEVLDQLASGKAPSAQGGDDAGEANQNQDQNNALKGTEQDLYDNLKAYFKDMFNYQTQTHGGGDIGKTDYDISAPEDVKQKTKQKAFGQRINQKKISSKITKPEDTADIVNLMEIKRLHRMLESIQKFYEAETPKRTLTKKELELFKSNIKQLNILVNIVGKVKTNDKVLKDLIREVMINPILPMKDLSQLLNSSPRSLKTFIRNFNNTLYYTEVKSGQNILDKLKKINISQLNEADEVDQQMVDKKEVMKEVLKARKIFLKNLPALLKSFYNLFSYLIKKSKQGTLGQDKQEDSETKPSSSEKSSDGSGSTDVQAAANNLLGNKQNESFEQNNLLGIINEHDKLMYYVYSELNEILNENEKFTQGTDNAIKSSDSGRIFTQLANVVPDITNKIAAQYKAEYGQQINRVKLAEFLQTVLGALAAVPQQRMVQMINKAGMDVTAYKKMLKAIKTADDQNQQDNQEQQDGQKVNDFDFKKPESFSPKVVGKYDLSGINQQARLALAKKSAEIIKQQGAVINRENMIEVMKQLLDDINSSGQKTIPTV